MNCLESHSGYCYVTLHLLFGARAGLLLCRFSLWEREFQAVDTLVSLCWLFPYVDTVVSLRVYSCFPCVETSGFGSRSQAAPGACYGNSV